MPSDLITHSEAETEALGAALGRLLQAGDALALVGDLGAGKTCLARGVAAGLGVREPVTSPTFILVAEYATARGFPLYHADCYRLEQAASEALSIGLDELLLDDGVAIVEWAERIEPLLPPDHLRITLTALDDSRRLTFEPQGARAAELVRRIFNGQCSIVNCQSSGDSASASDQSLPIDN
ncbi:MAG: tRNA (adenosine(37)-N6)-threonylcarbamoyltransferase complex ATPase subunit type 1 TsaE [Anaerolinea sp.]|nr:tRNA (adenosine(37)-N6)-threonylcarbamoyltransferase complex ATPase subunit type 1 TsaE [Anaerolinea sp.]